MSLDSLLQVSASPVHGLGVFAVRPIPQGAVLGRYGGRRYTAAQVSSRNWSRALTYVIGLPDGSVIDGARGGNAMRHLNHSCEPNCAAFSVKGRAGRWEVQIEVLRAIGQGEELLMDYRLSVEDAHSGEFACFCGVPTCRGTMLDEVS